MKLLMAYTGLLIGASTAAEAALIKPPCIFHILPACRIVGAPAPIVGSGIPVALAIAGVLLGSLLLKRWRRT